MMLDGSIHQTIHGCNGLARDGNAPIVSQSISLSYTMCAVKSDGQHNFCRKGLADKCESVPKERANATAALGIKGGTYNILNRDETTGLTVIFLIMVSTKASSSVRLPITSLSWDRLMRMVRAFWAIGCRQLH